VEEVLFSQRQHLLKVLLVYLLFDLSYFHICIRFYFTIAIVFLVTLGDGLGLFLDGYDGFLVKNVINSSCVQVLKMLLKLLKPLPLADELVDVGGGVLLVFNAREVIAWRIVVFVVAVN